MARRAQQSVEPKVADTVNGFLRSYGVDYKLEQESLNDEIDDALNEYASKRGGGQAETAPMRKHSCAIDTTMTGRF